MQERIYACSTISKWAIWAFDRMEYKRQTKGDGLFKFRTDVKKRENGGRGQMAQDFDFLTLKERAISLGSQQKASLKNEMEREFLRGVRLSEFHERDTVTVARYVVEDPQVFFNNVELVIDQPFSEQSLGVSELDEENGHLKTHTPAWFSPHQHCSMAQWACFFILRALKVNFER